jgi:hypothetical protein
MGVAVTTKSTFELSTSDLQDGHSLKAPGPSLYSNVLSPPQLFTQLVLEGYDYSYDFDPSVQGVLMTTEGLPLLSIT